MKHTCSTILAALILVLSLALPVAGGPYEDGAAAYVREDYATALKLLRPLAEGGNDSAQARLGLMYDLGHGVAQNYTEAAKWYRAAAEQGHEVAQLFLGLYSNGKGFPQNHSEAARWYAEAAERGNARAQGFLGSLYATGKGVPQDYAAALKWFRLAANQGDAEIAIQNRVDLLSGPRRKNELHRGGEVVSARCRPRRFQSPTQSGKPIQDRRRRAPGFCSRVHVVQHIGGSGQPRCSNKPRPYRSEHDLCADSGRTETRERVDLRALPLLERKETLARFLEKSKIERIMFSEHFDDGASLFKQACELGLEGIVSKRKNSSLQAEQIELAKSEMPEGSRILHSRFRAKRPRGHFGATSRAKERQRLRLCRQGRHGFSNAMSEKLRNTLDKKISDKPSLTSKLRRPDTKWVKPDLKAKIALPWHHRRERKLSASFVQGLARVAQRWSNDLEFDVDAAVAACGGHWREAIKALAITNGILWDEIARLNQSQSSGYSRKGTVKR